MYEYYFTFRSMTQAQQASFELSTNGIAATFVRAPKSISQSGCGYAVKIYSGSVEATITVFHSAGIRFEKVFRTDEIGQLREIHP